jgi:hypothetical protein
MPPLVPSLCIGRLYGLGIDLRDYAGELIQLPDTSKKPLLWFAIGRGSDTPHLVQFMKHEAPLFCCVL